MKRLFSTFLSTAVVCAFVSATPVAAQETVTGAPQGQTPITAEPPSAQGNGAVGGYSSPLGAVGSVIAAPFDAVTGSGVAASQPGAQCHVIQDFYGSHGRYTSVC